MNIHIKITDEDIFNNIIYYKCMIDRIAAGPSVYKFIAYYNRRL